MTYIKLLTVGFQCFLILMISCLACSIPDRSAFAGEGDTVVKEEPQSPVKQVDDPLQGVNRSVFHFNDKFYFWAVKPVAGVYASVFPQRFRDGVEKAVYNFAFPARFVNNLLQHNGERADIEMKRFIINSTVGMGGFFDPAQERYGLAKPPQEDFGQTLGVWGACSGPFLMAPVLGPSDARDFFGFVVDKAMDPMAWIPMDIWIGPVVKTGTYMNSASLKLGAYEDFKASAIDPYIAMRDAYLQHREYEIQQ